LPADTFRQVCAAASRRKALHPGVRRDDGRARRLQNQQRAAGRRRKHCCRCRSRHRRGRRRDRGADRRRRNCFADRSGIAAPHQQPVRGGIRAGARADQFSAVAGGAVKRGASRALGALRSGRGHVLAAGHQLGFRSRHQRGGRRARLQLGHALARSRHAQGFAPRRRDARRRHPQFPGPAAGQPGHGAAAGPVLARGHDQRQRAHDLAGPVRRTRHQLAGHVPGRAFPERRLRLPLRLHQRGRAHQLHGRRAAQRRRRDLRAQRHEPPRERP